MVEDQQHSLCWHGSGLPGQELASADRKGVRRMQIRVEYPIPRTQEKVNVKQGRTLL